MDLFGVEELAGSRSAHAPGWAYVPDLSNNNAFGGGPGGAAAAAAAAAAEYHAQQQNQQPRKRAARNILTHARDTTSRQDAKVLRELAELDREPGRDTGITSGRVSQTKQTPNVRKILASHKTFANHLSDFEASAALALSNSSTPAPRSSAVGTSTPPLAANNTNNASSASSKRSHKRKEPPKSQSSGRSNLRNVNTSDDLKADAGAEDKGSKSGIVLASFSNVPNPHPADADPLLQSRVPSVPTPEEMEALVLTPALTYGEARAEFTDEQLRKPVRKFCEICGYWGRVLCTRCGGRVCALECLKTHQEDCFTRYGP